jgi:hypothetical protein
LIINIIKDEIPSPSCDCYSPVAFGSAIGASICSSCAAAAVAATLPSSCARVVAAAQAHNY